MDVPEEFEKLVAMLLIDRKLVFDRASTELPIAVVARIDAQLRALQATAVATFIAEHSASHKHTIRGAQWLMAALTTFDKHNAVYNAARSWSNQFCWRINHCIDLVVNNISALRKHTGYEANIFVRPYVEHMVASTIQICHAMSSLSFDTWRVVALRVAEIQSAVFSSVDTTIVQNRCGLIVRSVVEAKLGGSKNCFSRIRFLDGARVQITLTGHQLLVRRIVWGSIPLPSMLKCSDSDKLSALLAACDNDRLRKHPIDALTDRVVMFESIKETKAWIASLSG